LVHTKPRLSAGRCTFWLHTIFAFETDSLTKFKQGWQIFAADCNFMTSQIYRLNSSHFGLSFPNGIQAGKAERPSIAAGL
jgi:hypothetical protein